MVEIESAQIQNILSSKPSPLILVSPDVGATLAVRTYPRKHFERVLKILLQDYPQAHICLIGTKKEVKVGEQILNVIGRDRSTNLCGSTTFPDLIQLLIRTDLLICNDSGPAHFGGLAGTKTLAIYSAETPFMYGPLGNKTVAMYNFYHCSPCVTAFNHKKTRCNNNTCISTIEPDAVVSLANQILMDAVKYQTVNGNFSYIL